MPGNPFMHQVPSFQDVRGEGAPPASPGALGNHLLFIFWLVVLGVIIPAAILGGLRFAGFQFIFRSR